jgi:hypothetical protein
MEGFGGPAQPSPAITECLNGGTGRVPLKQTLRPGPLRVGFEPFPGLHFGRNALTSFAGNCAWFEKSLNEYNDKSRLLIIGSQVRALVRPPIFSST